MQTTEKDRYSREPTKKVGRNKQGVGKQENVINRGFNKRGGLKRIQTKSFEERKLKNNACFKVNSLTKSLIFP